MLTATSGVLRRGGGEHATGGLGDRHAPLLATAHGLGVLHLFPDADTALATLAPR
ncbi:hypothetical protein [Kitasatospora purpeofusca]|uniref:Uncharacterized protein n=1 Tax=Kitasatospora purpeofusca TaxID=67352 RepID=A0ABZ1UBD2_9ACTN|nr:hypothetical protein [Kitasatospora purpeofusca]